MIEVKNVTVSYEHKDTVLHDINFYVEAGETIALVGANGTGKSTLLSVLVGILPNGTGSIVIHGKQLQKKNYDEIRKHMGLLFQNPDDQLFQASVYEDIAFAPRNYGIPEEEIEIRCREALHQLGREDLLEKSTFKISGGEKRIVALAGLLSMNPEILLMDEPTSFLDPRARRYFIECTKRLPQTKLIATHDLDMALDLCPRVLILYDGSVVADGKTEELLTDEALLQKYGLELPLGLSRRSRGV